MAPLVERPFPASLRFEVFFELREELRLRAELLVRVVCCVLFAIFKPYFLRPPFLPPLRDEL